MQYELSRNDTAQQYELTIGGEVAGYASFQERGDVLVLPHTVVEPQFRGQGLSKPLIQYALDDARDRGLKVVPACSAVAGFIDATPEYRDLV
ncbi:GNAT family N-acetyltransferase [Corynebacterium sp. Q4381]|uniref:GNAT family N-acetyltransferase n=1 Tax=Corynebacterium sp. Marseille-Q4381 TaxID=3121597 RepID=UPI002FE54903